MRTGLRRFAWKHGCACGMAAVLIFSASSGAWGGQKKKKKSKTSETSEQPLPAMPMSVSEQIDRDIGEMLGAFQLGDIKTMHKYYSDNATFVSGDYEPPIVGWQNYVPLYQREAAQFQGMQLIRRNTYIFTRGDVAWASYQWEFDSMLNGQPYTARGQTTLVFNKVGDNWLIVHNHTSQICPVCPAVGPSAPPTGQGQAPRRIPTPNSPAPTPPRP
jgi:ketosteroid isomerase-like protein